MEEKKGYQKIALSGYALTSSRLCSNGFKGTRAV
jgi:hypothetical protein